MKRIVLMLVVVTMVAAQDTFPWQGPFSPHVPGQNVPDTPEVAAAKLQHANAHAQVRAILPELPPEEIFPELHGPVHHHPHSQPLSYTPPPIPVHHHHHHNPHHVQHLDHHGHGHFSPTTLVTKFAEEIPRSEIGEVPEVAAARAAHLQAHLKANKFDASLTHHNPTPYNVQPQHQQHHHQSHYQPRFNGQFLEDTPEVAAAKLAHQKAYGK